MGDAGSFLTLSANDPDFHFSNVTITSITDPNVTYTIPSDGITTSMTIDLGLFGLPIGNYAITAQDINNNIAKTEITVAQ